jgi:type VI secretion system secreted protein Hcp
MASPAYVWIVDDQGNEVKGECSVEGREGSIEIFQFEYGVSMPVDKFNGTTNGTRQHDTVSITKPYDPTSPVLFKAACDGKTLKSIKLVWYKINENGKEEEYFTHTLDEVKVVSYKQKLRHTKDEINNNHVHEDVIEMRFSKITMKHHNGNIQHSDTWLQRS